MYQYQPVDTMRAFAQGFQFTDALRQRREQEQAQQQQIAQQQQRQASLQQAIQNIRTNPSPDAIAEFYLQFPEMKDQFDAYRGALGEGDKTTLTSAAREAIVAQRSGQSPAPVYRRYAEAAKNSGRMDIAKQFEDAAVMAETSAEGADLTARMFFQGVDPDGYKAIFEGQYDTAFLKELVAEGLEPGTPEFQQALKEKREADAFIIVPGIGLYRRADVERAAQGQTLAPAIPEVAAQALIREPARAAEFDKKYGAGASARILGNTGGGGSNATGGFRGP